MWHPAAEQEELAEIWLRATDRPSVTQAAHDIDQSLVTDPLTHGQEFYGDRLYIALPLAVTYTINEPDRIVQILQVWHL